MERSRDQRGTGKQERRRASEGGGRVGSPSTPFIAHGWEEGVRAGVKLSDLDN